MPGSERELRELTSAQRGIWYAHQISADKALYNLSEYMDIRGELVTDLFVSAVRQAVAESDTFRLRFTGDDETVRQFIGPPAEAPVELLDLTGEADPQAAAEAWMTADTARPVDLLTEPPFRHAVFRIAPDRHLWYHRMHHLVCDGFSASIVAARVARLYTALTEGHPAGEGALESVALLLDTDTADRASAARTADRDYWTTTLSGLPEPAATTPHRPARPRRYPIPATGDGPDTAATRLRTAARRLRTTVAGLALTAAAVHLHRTTHRRDIVLGLSVSGRTGPREKSTPGMTAGVLPIRLRVDRDATARDLVRRISAAVREALRHDRYPQTDLLHDLGRTHGAPLFDLLVNVMSFDYPARVGACTATTRVRSTGPVDNLRLCLYERPAEGKLDIALDVSATLYDDPAGHALSRSLARALDWVLTTEPTGLVREAPLLDPADRRRVLQDWNATATAGPAPLVPDLFAAQVRRTPDAVAVVSGGTAVSYRELDARANRFAHHLLARGVGAESVVALCLPRGLATITGMLGAWKAGAAYLPLDEGWPAERIAQMVADSGALQVSSADLTGLPSEAPDVTVRPGQIAYVVYTSGSTGRPKGVAVPHGALANYVASVPGRVGFDGPGRYAVLQGQATDLGNTVVFASLAGGGELHVLDEDVATDAEAVGRYLAEHQIDFLKAVPSHVAALGARSVLPARSLVLGGEAASPQLVEELLAGDCEVFNHYGPTETTIGVATTRLTDGMDVVPVGTPVANTRLYVLDAALEPVAPATNGELYVAGAQLARGYVGRPGATAERFVACPYGGPGERMYRTGDLARWTGQGQLVFGGRADDQVKIRGFRVEPREVQAVVAAHPQVTQAVVTAREDGPGDTRLVAYVVTDAPEPHLSIPEFVAARLPEHMVPTAVVALDALPLTGNGKVDRAALPAPATAPAHDGPPDARPAGLREELLCGAFAHVLGVDTVGADDDFFRLGGHSLLAIRLISRIRRALDVELPIEAFFEAPTPRALAARLDTAAHGRTAPRPMPRPRRLPLSAAQRRLWILDRLEGSGTAYTGRLTLPLSGDLDVVALARALQDVVERHEGLRTVFPTADEEPYQKILTGDEARFPMPVVPLTPEELPAATAEASSYAFDLASELPLRPTLFDLGNGAYLLHIAVHHILGDGWSLVRLGQDLSTAYAARLKGAPPGWAPLPLQYADYTLWQRGLLGADGDPDSLLSRQVAYWRRALEGAPEELELPFDRPRPAAASHRGHTVGLTLPAESHRHLTRLARERGATLFMVLQAGLAMLLSRLGAGQDIPVGSALAGRTDEALHDLVGFFVNTLVVRTDLSGDPTFDEVLGRVRQTTLAAYAHQDVPFERLVEELAPPRSPSRHPLFQVMLTLQNNAVAQVHLPGTRPSQLTADTTAARFDLELSVREAFDADGTPAGLTGTLIAAADLFDTGTAERLAARWSRVMAQLAEDPRTRLSAVDPLEPDERERLLTRYNDTAADSPSATLPELFAARAARTPDAVAVVADGTEVTYAELDARANRLAHHLAGRGVGPESVVGVCLERGAGLVVALLAVLKAGAAYLPVDPEQPAERIAGTLADADAVCVLTTSALAGALPAGAPRLVLDDPSTARETERQPATAPPTGPLPEHPAYVIFTSGSTGRPKGVVVPHSGIVNRLTWMQHRYGLTPADRVLQKTPFGFDVSVWEFFWPLLEGATLVTACPGGHRDPAYVAELVREQRVTTAHFVPSMLEVFLAEPTAAVRTGLRRVICSGEALPAHVRTRFFDLLPDTELHNLYGPTEASVDVTAWECRPGHTSATVPIGLPVANTRVYALDGTLRPVPEGTSGELYLEGVQLARGYAGRPALTAERFVASPFTPGARLYRTGDIVRWNTGGQLEYLRRADDQVKIRGLRVEPGEIRAALAGHPALERVAVTVREDTPGDRRLIAYVVPAVGPDGAPADVRPASVRAFAGERLPAYMVPAAVVVLPELPLTPNGKLDHRRLPAPAHPSTAEAGRAPADEREKSLCDAFAEILGAPTVGVEDDFFALGGHSLLAIRLGSRLRTELGVDIPLPTLFERPTPAGLAAWLGEHAGPRKKTRPALRPRRTQEESR
ncbi:amino acid adenylation domain-containing protein [Streptomyces sp. NPDC001833]|uniref:amino acid adenylation domain-containing protein n=1 Tax=Streptomyces sp. NPDC001833 TaxID=3154658 RepID=UPI00331BE4C2